MIFVLEVVSALVTVLLVRDLVTGGGKLGFTFQIALWLWFTVLFANFAEAVAEGRGTRAGRHACAARAPRRSPSGSLMPDNREVYEGVSAAELAAG